MLKLISYSFLLFLISSCCSPTKTYESFSEDQKRLLYYLDGQLINYKINSADSINLFVSDKFIGNLPPDEPEAEECDNYYPAYGRATLQALTDTSVHFIVTIKKSNDDDGIAENLKWMGYNINLDDSDRVDFYDSLLLKGADTFKDVYVVTVDTTNTRNDLINRIYFSTHYGIIRFDRKDGRVYRIKI